MSSPDYARITMCALDFIRALHERPRILQWIFHVIVGKYAWREFRLMNVNLELDGFNPEFDYDIQETDYNKMSNAEFESMIIKWRSSVFPEA